MPEPLTQAEIARMKAEHVPDSRDPTICGAPNCFTPYEHSAGYPCDAALLLAELERLQTAKAWEAFPAYSGPPVPLPKEYIVATAPDPGPMNLATSSFIRAAHRNSEKILLELEQRNPQPTSPRPDPQSSAPAAQ